MTCESCGDKPKHTAKDFTKAVIEINNPEKLVLFRKVVLPASMGTEEDVPAEVGKYFNVLLVYEANEHIYLYSSDGIPTLLSTEIGDLEHIEQAIRELQGDVETLSSSLSSEAEAREAADTRIEMAVSGLTDALASETTARTNADATINRRIDTLTTNLATEISTRQTADDSLQDQIDDIDEVIPAQASAQNQLADKDFVNSSVATNTANYISDNGQPFVSLADLEAYSGTLTNNDYAFVLGTDITGNITYTRYKYVASTQTWAEEYVLNNSSFTANQWAAINSGITSGDVTKLAGLANIKTIGANLTLDANGGLSATDTTYSDFVGTDGAAAGTHGLVPAPATTDAGKFLKADGTWDTAGSAVNVVQTTGTSTTDVMSQNATTSMVYADPSYRTRVQIGSGAQVDTNGGVAVGPQAVSRGQGVVIGANSYTTGRSGVCISSSAQAGDFGVAIGQSADASPSGSIALGTGSAATQTGEMNIGSSVANWGYNNSNYRLLTGLYDPQSAHDAVNKQYCDSVTPTITMTTTDPGEGSALAANNFIGVYGDGPIIMDYSVNEIDTGAKWIDGTAIYKKTISFGTLPNATSKNVAHGISDLGWVVKTEGITKHSSSGDFLPLPFASVLLSSNGNIDLKVSSTYVTVDTLVDRREFTETYITIYYTKST